MIRCISESSGITSWLINGPAMDIPDGPVWSLIEQSLVARPSADCVTCGPITLTRRELLDNVRSFRLMRNAHRVGVHVARSIASLTVTLAAWSHGSTYVPLPPEHPPARIAALVASCEVDLVVTDTGLSFDGFVCVGQNASLDRPLFFWSRGVDVDSKRNLTPGSISYIAHTSGSTGGPKSVRIGQAALINRIIGMIQVLGAGEHDVFLYKTSSVFDVHVWEFVLPLVTGGFMVIYPQAPYFDLLKVARLMTDHHVTFAGFVPGLLSHLINIKTFTDQNSLQTVLCGGEAWGPHLAQRFYSALPGRRLYNSYGPAETTISVANYQVPEDFDRPLVPLGYPMPNVYFLVEQHEDMADEPSGIVTGMLSIGGDQVGIGYLDNRLADNFFQRWLDGNDRRFYRTGDLVRLDTRTSLITFIGREDTQIKINGVRIELQEIETVITGIGSIESCVALVDRSGPAPLLCVAFKTKSNSLLDADLIRNTCRKELPAALVPSRLRQVTQFPLLMSGKIDRSGLLQQFTAST